MTTTTTTATKKLLTESGAHALQDLHKIFGFDFCAPYNAYIIQGKYTINQIRKLTSADGYTPENSVTIVCTHDKNRAGFYDGNFHLVEIDRYNKIDIDFSYPRSPSNIGIFWAKYQFEDVRKKDTAETIVFCQMLDSLKHPTKKSPDFSERVKVLQARKYCHYYGEKVKYISGFDFKVLNGKGEKYDYKISRYQFKEEPTELTSIIDKSGYLLVDRRDNLKRRAQALRAEREKAAADAIDNSAKIEILRELLAERKPEIIEQLKRAETSEQVEKVADALNRWRGFGGLLYDFEKLQERETNKEYKSIEQFERAYLNIYNPLTGNALETLAELKIA